MKLPMLATPPNRNADGTYGAACPMCNRAILHLSAEAELRKQECRCVLPEPPALFGEGEKPPFPQDTLPGWLCAYVVGLAEATQTPADLAGTLALAVCATATAQAASVEAGPDWYEPVNLFCVVTLPSGSRKSVTFARLTEPLEEWERKRNADTMEAAAQSGEQQPKLLRLIADDATSESITRLLAEQGGRLAVLSSEGGLFDTVAGRYSDKIPNLEVLLKGHSGDNLRVDRIGREPLYVRHPALTIGITVQPDVLEGLHQKPGFRGRGLLARFLYALPPDNVGRRKLEPCPVPAEVQAAYWGGMENLLALKPKTLEDGQTRPCILHLEPQAHQEFLAFRADVESKLLPEGYFGGMRDWGSKFPGHVARIAGLLHLAQHGVTQNIIQATTMRNAIRLGWYYAAHAKAAFEQMGTDRDTEGARVLIEWLKRTKQTQFSKRDAHNALQSRFPRAADLDRPLEILLERFYVAEQETPERAGAGRKPSPTYRLSPYLCP